ncbi:MAG TPA: nucleotide sugar dehydrogenase [Patescibacteria group bacterium]|nr:nucleotide sugar dehydrogenase [Patescibacteria group bacterium]
MGKQNFKRKKINLKNEKHIAVVGLGYVGLPLAVLAVDMGYKVTGIDVDQAKLNLIKKGFSPFKDDELEAKIRKLKFELTSDFAKIKNASIIIICVPTPVYENRLPNYEPLKSACTSIAAHLRKGQLVILESTVNPGVCEEIVIPIVEEVSHLAAGEFMLAHVPERINPGDKNWNVSNIPRVVGGYDAKSTQTALTFYRSILSAPLKKMGNLKEAEAVKVVENSFRNVNIAFVNELAQSFSKLGIDVVHVIDGASTKPFAFMPHYPGCGVGGHCIPVDPYYLIDYAKKNGYSHKFLSLACKVNEEMPEYTVDLYRQEIKKLGKNMRGSKAVVLGLSYKSDIDDTRESPSLNIVKLLKKYGVHVKTYDPYVQNGSHIKNLNDAIENVDAVIVATNHKEFLNLEAKELIKNHVGIVIDGRNCLEKEDFIREGVLYRGIGR